jgi:hypothetical protein
LASGKPFTARELQEDLEAKGSMLTAPDGAQSKVVAAYNDLVTTSNRMN